MWKSVFIKHAHYTQLTTLEWHVIVQLSVSAATRKVLSESIHEHVKSLQMVHTSDYLLPPTPVTQHKWNVH